MVHDHVAEPRDDDHWEEWAMIRLFVIGEKLAIDKTERATNLN
jgi:hypothetical protein